MAGKLSIRRVGNFLPSLCLAGVLLVIAIITWLCTVGLPDCALRYIEQEAAKAGVQLSIDKIRLSPSSGMAAKAEDVVVTLPQADAAPATLKVRKVQVAYSIARMLTGQFRPYNIRVVDGTLSLPLSEQEGDKLELKGIDLYTVFQQNGKGIVSTLKARLHHADLETRLVLADTEKALTELNSENAPEAGSSQSPAELLADLRPQLREIQRQLKLQQWSDTVYPHLKLNFIQGKAWKITLDGSVPSYEWEQFHFRDAKLSAAIENSTITIDNLSFKTVEPDTAVTLQGGYDWAERELLIIINEDDGHHGPGTDVFIPDLVKLRHIGKIQHAQHGAEAVVRPEHGAVDPVAAVADGNIAGALGFPLRQPAGGEAGDHVLQTLLHHHIVKARQGAELPVGPDDAAVV